MGVFRFRKSAVVDVMPTRQAVPDTSRPESTVRDAGFSHGLEILAAMILVSGIGVGYFTLNLPDEISCAFESAGSERLGATGKGCGEPDPETADDWVEPVYAEGSVPGEDLESWLDGGTASAVDAPPPPPVPPAPPLDPGTKPVVPPGAPLTVPAKGQAGVVAPSVAQGSLGSGGKLGQLNGFDIGYQVVPGLGKRKQEILAAGATVQDLAVAMQESDTLTADYAYGDNKGGQSTNFGIFKQNWAMIHKANPALGPLGNPSAGAVLNTDLRLDIATLQRSRVAHPGRLWVKQHRWGSMGLDDSNKDLQADIGRYEDAVNWIATQLSAEVTRGVGGQPYLSNDVRFWVVVPPV